MHNQKVTNLGVRKLQLLKDYDGVYNWLQLWGRGSERPKAQTQQKLTQIPSPPPPPISVSSLEEYKLSFAS